MQQLPASPPMGISRNILAHLKMSGALQPCVFKSCIMFVLDFSMALEYFNPLFEVTVLHHVPTWFLLGLLSILVLRLK